MHDDAFLIRTSADYCTLMHIMCIDAFHCILMHIWMHTCASSTHNARHCHCQKLGPFSEHEIVTMSSIISTPIYLPCAQQCCRASAVTLRCAAKCFHLFERRNIYSEVPSSILSRWRRARARARGNLCLRPKILPIVWKSFRNLGKNNVASYA